MASLRDVADHAGVSVATASRVVSGSAAVRPETRERVERAMRDLLYVPPGRVEPSGAIGLLRARVREPGLRARSPRRWRCRRRAAGSRRSSATRTGRRGRERDYVHMLLERRRRGDGLHLRRDHRRPRQALALRQAARARRAARVRERRLRGSRRDVRRRRRARRRDGSPPSTSSSSATSASASSPATRSRCRRARRPSDTATRSAPRGSPTVSSRMPTFTVGGGREALRELLEAAGTRRPTGVICSSDLMAHRRGAGGEGARPARSGRRLRSSASTGSTRRRGRSRR